MPGTRLLIATYLAEFPHIARESGVSPDLLQQIGRDHRGQVAAAVAALLDDGIVTSHSCTGTVDEVRASLSRRRAAGVQSPIVGVAESQMASYLGDLIAD